MDYNSLNTDVPIPVLAIVFWILAALAFVVMIRSQKIRAKFPDLIGLGTLAGVAMIGLIVCGFVGLSTARMVAQNADFNEKLSSDYGLRTESPAYEVKKAAQEGRSVSMSDESGRIDVRPQLDGDKLNFYKLDKGTLINPRK